MEVAGLAIGVAGLSGLFSACVDCFELVQRGRYLGKDFLLLETKFTNQRLRLITWGRACGFANPGGYDSRLNEDGEVRNCIESTLVHLLTLLRNGNNLRCKYGVREDDHSDHISLALSKPSSWLKPNQLAVYALGRKVQELGERVRSTQKGNGPTKTIRWVVEDRQKFADLIQHLKDLIDDLEGLTRFAGIQERQQELIDQEIEAINDIPALETIEEARASQRDPISDAASIRLWTVRDRFRQPDGSDRAGINSTHMSPASSQIDESEDDFDILPTIPTMHPSPTDGANYQYLHRVLCSSSPTAIFLDEPTHNPVGKDGQWLVLDERYPTQNSKCLHLCGKRAVPDLAAYLSRCRTIEWVVIKDYHCQHSLECLDNPPAPEGKSIRLVSEALCSSLKGMSVSSYIDSSLPDFERYSELASPFLWYWKHKNDLQECLDSKPEEIRSPALRLLNFIDDLMTSEYSTVERQLQRKSISLKYIDYVFVSWNSPFNPSAPFLLSKIVCWGSRG